MSIVSDIVRMFHPDNGTNDSFPVDKEGFHLVPNGPEVADMLSHGFFVEGDDPKKNQEMPAMVPAADHMRVVDRVSQLETEVRDLHMDKKVLAEAKDTAMGMIESLEAKLEEALKAKTKN